MEISLPVCLHNPSEPARSLDHDAGRRCPVPQGYPCWAQAGRDFRANWKYGGRRWRGGVGGCRSSMVEAGRCHTLPGFLGNVKEKNCPKRQRPGSRFRCFDNETILIKCLSYIINCQWCKTKSDSLSGYEYSLQIPFGTNKKTSTLPG